MKSNNNYEELFNHFWTAIDTEKFVPKTRSEIDSIITEIYLSGDPLVEIDKKTQSNIRKGLQKKLNFVLNNEVLEIVAENPVLYILNEQKNSEKTKYDALRNIWEMNASRHNYLIMTKIKQRYEYWYHMRQQAMEIALKLGGKILSKKEKKEHFSDREIWEEARYTEDNSQVGFSLWGHRRLFSEGTFDSYGHERKEFIKLVEKIKKDTGKSRIELLDIGGGFGEACEDAQNLNIGIHATNLLIDPLPIEFRTDTILCCAERMPKEFKNSYDIIISNMAFRYFSYPDIALENVIQSLSVGGTALISAGADRPEFIHEDFARGLAKQYARMKQLHDQGKIILNVSQKVLDFIPTSENYFPSAWVEIKKLKEI